MRVVDQKGRPVADAVVAAHPVGGAAPAAADRPVLVIDQIGKEFVPQVTVVRVGTRISFPNRDDIRHHVYSFSEAKTFELPLYKGTPTEPVAFDSPGLVVLGCNIHDWMMAYVYVLDTPFFATTDDEGRATLDLPPGPYDVEVHHFRSKIEVAETRQRLEVPPAGVSAEQQLPVKPDFGRGRSASRRGADYR